MDAGAASEGPRPPRRAGLHCRAVVAALGPARWTRRRQSSAPPIPKGCVGKPVVRLGQIDRRPDVEGDVADPVCKAQEALHGRETALFERRGPTPRRCHPRTPKHFSSASNDDLG